MKSKASPWVVGFVTVAIFSSLFACSVARGGPFQNLDFEETDGVESGVPHWQVAEEVYLYNSIFAGEGSVTLYDWDFPSFYKDHLPPEVHDPLVGDQSILMIYDPVGPPNGGPISQVGEVPANAVRIILAVTDLLGIQVSLDGTVIPLTSVQNLGNFDLVTGNVSAFAGTTARLTISAPGETHSISAFDAIAFIVPEPAALKFAVLGLIALVNLRGRTPLPAAICAQ